MESMNIFKNYELLTLAPIILSSTIKPIFSIINLDLNLAFIKKAPICFYTDWGLILYTKLLLNYKSLNFNLTFGLKFYKVNTTRIRTKVYFVAFSTLSTKFYFITKYFNANRIIDS